MLLTIDEGRPKVDRNSDNTVDRDLNQYKIVVPLFGAAYAAPYKGTTILY